MLQRYQAHRFSNLKNIKEGIILIGNESKGISEELLNMASKKITIPQIWQCRIIECCGCHRNYFIAYKKLLSRRRN